MFGLIQKYRKVITHILCWGVIIAINIFDIEDMALREGTLYFQLPIWLTFIFSFYINYFILIPKLLEKKHQTLYTISVFVFLFIGFIAIKIPHQLIKKDAIAQIILKMENNEPVTSSDKRLLGPSFKIRTIKYAKKHHEEILNVSEFNPLHPRNAPYIYGILLVLAISFIARFSQIWKDEERKRMEQDREKVSSELEYLKQQINPHFLFNSLNSIYSLSLVGSQNTSDCILKLSSILRYVLYKTNKYVNLEDEMDVINDYIGLQKLKLTAKTQLTFNAEGEFEKYKIEPLLLIPVIENAFKYGVDSSKTSFIEIDIIVKDEKITLTTKNSFDNTLKPIKESGIGLKNVKRRLDLIYPNRHKLVTSSKNNIFEVKLDINL